MRRPQDYRLQLLTKLVQIPSPSGSEREISNFLAQEMSKLNFRVARDKVGNVIADRGEGHPHVLLCGHMDTVPGEVPYKLRGKHLYGRGSVDAKSALAAMILAASKMESAEVTGRITVAGLVDEEGNGLGMDEFLERGFTCDYAIFGEPSGTTGITIAYKGALRVRLRLTSHTGHAASPQLFPNAIRECFRLYQQIENACLSIQKLSSPFERITTELTLIEGGQAPNMIPNECTATLDIRYPPGISRGQLESAMEAAASNIRSDQFNIETEILGHVQPYRGNSGGDLISSLAAAIRKVTGETPVLLKKTGSSDLNVWASNRDTAAVAYGPGDSKLDHTDAENIQIDDYLKSIDVLKECLLTLFSKKPDGGHSTS